MAEIFPSLNGTTYQLPLAARQALAANMQDAGTVEGAALSDTIATGVAPRAFQRQALLELNEDYSKFADGEPVTTLTGQTYKLRGSLNVANDRPTVESGFLTQRIDANNGAYSEIGPFAQSINHWGARWKFEAETVAGGVMCLALMTKSYVDYSNSTGNVPKSGPHLLITKTTLQVTVFPADGSSPQDSGLGVVTFSAGLPMDDSTLLAVDLFLDNVTGTLYIYAPDGKMYAVQNDYFKDQFLWVFAEPFRNAEYVTGMSRAKFSKFWASSVSDAELARVAASYWQRPVVQKTVIASSDVSFALTATPSAPAGALTTFTGLVPPTKRVRIKAAFMIDITSVVASSQIRTWLQSSAGAGLTYAIVAQKVSQSGYCEAVIEHSLTEAVGGTWTRKIAFAVTDTVRTDTAGTTSGSPTVTDTSITAADFGRKVTGTGIPANSYIGTVTAGVSFKLSSSATTQVDVNATATGTPSIIVGATAGASTTASLVLMPQVNGIIDVVTI